MKPGDICYHKATQKRCVISGYWNDALRVTTEDGESVIYKKEELWTEAEWEERNK
jgi:hypothetical protein